MTAPAPHTHDCACGACLDVEHEAARVSLETARQIATWLKTERAIRRLAGDTPMTPDEEIAAIRMGAWRRT